MVMNYPTKNGFGTPTTSRCTSDHEDEEEIDVETVEEIPRWNRHKRPLIVLNPNALKAYNRSTITSNSDCPEDDTCISLYEEDDEVVDDWRQQGTIEIVDPDSVDLELLSELDEKVFEATLQIQKLMKNNNNNQLQLSYNFRESIGLIHELTATIISIQKKFSTANKRLTRFEDCVKSDLFFVGDDLADASSDLVDQNPLIPMPFLNFFGHNDLYSEHRLSNYPISLSIQSFGKYILLLTYFRRFQNSPNYCEWNECFDAYYRVLVKIVGPFHRFILSSLVESYMKINLNDYLVSSALSWYAEEGREIQKDVKSGVFLPAEEWIKLKSSFPPVFFKQEAENLRELVVHRLKMKKKGAIISNRVAAVFANETVQMNNATKSIPEVIELDDSIEEQQNQTQEVQYPVNYNIIFQPGSNSANYIVYPPLPPPSSRPPPPPPPTKSKRKRNKNNNSPPNGTSRAANQNPVNNSSNRTINQPTSNNTNGNCCPPTNGNNYYSATNENPWAAFENPGNDTNFCQNPANYQYQPTGNNYYNYSQQSASEDYQRWMNYCYYTQMNYDFYNPQPPSTWMGGTNQIPPAPGT